MQVAYLLNTYPLISTTFIRREIESVEALGVRVLRFAVRKWSGSLVDVRDLGEQARTQYLLSGNLLRLFLALFRELLTNPLGILDAVPPWFKLLRRANGQTIRHIAYFMEAIHFRQLAEKNRICHVHAHFATNATTVAMLAKIMGGPSYSFTVHGPDEFANAKWLSFDAKISNAAFVVAISDFCKSELLKLSPPDHASKIHVARCGLALEDFEEYVATHVDNQTLVCVGRLCPQKGQISIPPVVATLRPEFPDLRVILVGDGESRQEVEKGIKAWNVGDLVEVRGWQANDKVLALIANCRALLLPSYAEGLPIVIMEALALGRPVISTKVAGIPELIDETCGWLFDPGNIDQMMSAMRASLTSPSAKLVQMGLAGRSRVAALHDRRALAKFLRGQFQHRVAEASHASWQ